MAAATSATWAAARAEDFAWQGRAQSILINLPPLATVAFKLDGKAEGSAAAPELARNASSGKCASPDAVHSDLRAR